MPDMGAAETNAAIEAAHRAFKPWATRLAKERSRILRRWYDLIVEHADELALLLTKEQGKPLAEAKGEIIYGAAFVELFAEEAKRIYGETIPTHKADARIVIMKQPVGVVAAITPWNFPSAMITRKVAPALAVGCTVVVKPAEDTPLSALALVELAERAGLPKGVLNVVTAKNPVPVGAAMTVKPARAHGDVHRLDRGRQDPDGAGCRHREARRHGAWRQCAVHRVRRRRPRQGGGRCHGVEVPQRRADVRVRQPYPGAGQRL